MQYGFNSQ